jgi:hypothetical protein
MLPTKKRIMKRFTMVALIVLMGCIAVLAQPCLPGGITFSTQEQINNFQTNYPNCTEIEGDVIIGGDDISNLNGLEVLSAVGGFL